MHVVFRHIINSLPQQKTSLEQKFEENALYGYGSFQRKEYDWPYRYSRLRIFDFDREFTSASVAWSRIRTGSPIFSDSPVYHSQLVTTNR